jgi:2-phospho-L-lactate guanylyltransferase (CobY/MobA/RfbA family)
MPSLVVPFRGVKGKSRLAPLPTAARVALGRAMLDDVVEACAAVGATFVVAPGELELADAVVVSDPGGGQGAAVRAGLAAAALASGGVGPFVVVNADLPCVTPRDLLTLAGAIPHEGRVIAVATDGTTNALGLASPELFVSLYGAGSAARFAALPGTRVVEAPNLIDDVDTLADLGRVRERLGPRTRGLLASLRLEVAA